MCVYIMVQATGFLQCCINAVEVAAVVHAHTCMQVFTESTPTLVGGLSAMKY